MATSPALDSIHKATENIEKAQRAIAWKLQDQIGTILYDQTCAEAILNLLVTAHKQLTDASFQFVTEYTQHANEATNNMFNACLAGAAIADPDAAPALKEFMFVTNKEDTNEG